jgi:hypothetical protein
MRMSRLIRVPLKVFPLKGEGTSTEFILTGQLAIYIRKWVPIPCYYKMCTTPFEFPHL